MTLDGVLRGCLQGDVFGGCLGGMSFGDLGCGGVGEFGNGVGVELVGIRLSWSGVGVELE